MTTRGLQMLVEDITEVDERYSEVVPSSTTMQENTLGSEVEFFTRTGTTLKGKIVRVGKERLLIDKTPNAEMVIEKVSRTGNRR